MKIQLIKKIKHLQTLSKSSLQEKDSRKALVPSPKIGMRTLKTGLAVGLSVLASELPIAQNSFYVAIGSVFALQSTVHESFINGKQRVIGTLLGGSIGFLFSLIIPYFPPLTSLLIGTAVILTILICNQLKKPSAILIAITICLSILLTITDQHPLIYSLNRTIDTVIGLGIGVLINYFIARPNYFVPLIQTFKHYLSLIEKSPQTEDGVIQLKKELTQLDNLTHHFLLDSPKDSKQTHLICELSELCHLLRFTHKALTQLSSDIDQPSVELIQNYYFNQFNLHLIKARLLTHQLETKTGSNERKNH